MKVEALELAWLKGKLKSHLPRAMEILMITMTYLNGPRLFMFHCCMFHSFVRICSKPPNYFVLYFQANGHGSLQIICEYYQLRLPERGSTLTFHPLEHLHSLKFHRPGETLLHIAGSSIDLRSFSTSLEVAEVCNFWPLARLKK